METPIIILAFKQVGDEGLEDSYKSLGMSQLADSSYAPDYALGPNSQVTDQGLAELIAAWRWLPDSVKSEISRLARSAAAEGGRP